MRETVDFPPSELPRWIRKNMAELATLAENRRVRYLAIVYGLEDRGHLQSYMALFTRSDLRAILGRALLRAAISMIGGSQATLALVPTEAKEAPPTDRTVH